MKNKLHWIGSALAILGIVFVVIRLRDYGGQIDFERFGWVIWGWVGAFSIIYGLANVMLSLAWWHLLDFCNIRVAKLWAIKVYGVTQLAKYVPGNIMHFAGRQAIGMAAGLSGGALAKTIAFELGLLSVAGGVLGLLALPLLIPHLSVFVCVLLLLVGLLVSGLVMRYLSGWSMVCAFCWYFCFLIISGGVFVGLLCLVSESEISRISFLLPLCGAYVVAWLAGLVTPGAPAGIGVREMVLLLLLDGLVTETNLLAVVMFGRIVTVVGDTLFFALVSLNFFQKKELNEPFDMAD